MSILGLSWGKNFSALESETDLPDIFPLSCSEKDFVRTDTLTLFTKILTDVIERTEGINDAVMPLLWDNCLQSESNKGLVQLLADAISQKNDLFLVWDKTLKVLREATNDEKIKIREDYKRQAKSPIGIFVSFKNYLRADMIKLYSALEYAIVASLSKNMNLSKAIMIKIKDLRGSVNLTDAARAQSQAGKIANLLAKGKDIYTDAGDTVETATPDLDATREAMSFLDSKRSFYLGLPNSYLTGESPKGLGDSGQGESKAIDRGLKIYYFSIVKPVVEELFQIKTTFKPQDAGNLSVGLDALKTFSLLDEELINLENKTKIINKLLDLPENAKGIQTPEPEADPNAGLKLPPIPTDKKDDEKKDE